VTYFSRVTIDPRDLSAGRVVHLLGGNGYREHQTIWRLFAGDPDATRDFLYRRDVWRGIPRYSLVSRRPPRDDTGLWHIETKSYAPRIHEGQHLAFALRANPVVTRKGEDGRGHRHDVVMDAKRRSDYRQRPPSERPTMAELIHDACMAWLEPRASRHGFEISPAQVGVEGYRPQAVGNNKKGSRIRISTVDITGALRVTDVDRFLTTLVEGVGPAKAFGCGLLLVRPA